MVSLGADCRPVRSRFSRSTARGGLPRPGRRKPKPGATVSPGRSAPPRSAGESESNAAGSPAAAREDRGRPKTRGNGGDGATRLRAEIDEILAGLPNLAGRGRPGWSRRDRESSAAPVTASRRTSTLHRYRMRRSANASADGFCPCRQALRFALCRAARGARPARTGARPVHARSAYDRVRLYRSFAAAPGSRRGRVRHEPAAKVRGGSVPHDRRLLADSDR